MDSVLVVGDGPVADALVPMAEILGWRPVAVTTLDDVLTALPQARAVVVTSHHDDVDGPALVAALAAPDVEYVGAMGSRRTQERRRAHLTDARVAADDQARIHAPIGLDIGADGPAEIALAILAELISVVRGGRAGSIKDREGPIHPDLGPGEAFCPTG